MDALLRFDVPLDLSLLEQVVSSLYQGSSPQQIAESQKVLSQLQERISGEEASSALNWFRVDMILESATLSANTKFYALQILESAIKYRWKTLPAEQCTGIKGFIVNLVIARSSTEESYRGQKIFMSKLNVILVQIVKQEWPHNWPSFISDIVNASKTNETLCENNMIILKLLSEEVFDFSRDEMTSSKAKRLKESFNADFSLIFQLCEYIMANSSKSSLLVCTFQTLLKFLNWIPLGYIFETQLVKTLVYKFLPQPAFRNDVLACLTEIGSLDMGTIYESLTGDIGAAYDVHFETLFTEVATAISVGVGGQPPPMVLPDTDMGTAFANGSDEDQTFIQNLALFFTCFFRQHLAIAERTAASNPALLQSAMYLLVNVSAVEDQEVFKICLEYWNMLSSDLYHTECQFQPPTQSALVLSPIPPHTQTPLSPNASPRRQLYSPVLSKLRVLLVQRMAKPEEVLIVEDENGEIVRETMRDSDAITLYKTMRETLVYLTHLNYDDTENIMLERLQQQVDGQQWSWHNLNTLCWAIGSISGAMSEEDEKRFLVTVIKDLLGLCEMKRGKDNKAVVASNIMYVVGQYPRFLRAHWKFLKTVVNKLFEFMHELHPGVQDMACDTFLKISQKCRRKFVILQVGEAMPFIDELCLNLRAIISDLEPGQVQVFYEAVSYMVSAQADAPTRDGLLMKLMEWPNQMWFDILAQAKATNGEALKEASAMKQLQTIIRTNERVAFALGNPYTVQLGHIYVDLLNVYKAFSELINTTIASSNGNAHVMHTSAVRAMRAVKKETLRLLDTFIEKSEDNDLVLTKFVPPLLDPVLGDYVRSIPDARDPEVLSLFTCLLNKLQSMMTQEVPRVFEAVFKCTLDMITKNFEDYPEHRSNLFNLLRAINHHCFPALLTNQGNFTLIIESIKWAFKHTERNVAETGLNTLLELLSNVQASQVGNDFYRAYYLGLLQDVFYVLTDTLHKPGFKLHAQILATLFQAVQDDVITVPLWPQDGSVTVAAGTTNQGYIQNLLLSMFSTSFPNLTQPQLTVLIGAMFNNCKDQAGFKQHLRDFLVQLKEFGDSTELYAEEQAAAADTKALEMRKRQEAVPGLLNPHVRQDDMDM
mmetsp:Transcript_46953/g.93552  ORF Transcript_46953/g.93552 Transcript_46953/m.93552 type:complete len:1107 (-) Transcript_46953:612-3932(-)